MTAARGARTCVGCGKPDGRDALLRLVVVDEPPYVVPDIGHRLAGRGASVHPVRSCVETALRNGGLSRALRKPVRVEARRFMDLLVFQFERRLDGLLMAAARTRKCAVGTDAVRACLREGQARLLCVAADAAGRRDELVSLAVAAGVPVVEFGPKARLGRLFGRDAVGVVAVTHKGIGIELADAADRRRLFSEEA
jgi:predicted RNA-binding protein YlxR (DUF448 family)/ribosomal protein L7Ae-like RNA K-turn-binding protein